MACRSTRISRESKDACIVTEIGPKGATRWVDRAYRRCKHTFISPDQVAEYREPIARYQRRYGNVVAFEVPSSTVIIWNDSRRVHKSGEGSGQDRIPSNKRVMTGEREI